LATLDLNTDDFTTIGVLPGGIAGITVIPNVIPEPSSFVLLATGAFGIFARRRRRSRKSALTTCARAKL
jgi:hypothetical protein